MNILSVFDGISCGNIAMKNAGVNIDRYVAYEIDQYAIEATQHNFPYVEQMGDVFTADFTKYKGFDFLIGGSPCFTKGHLVLTDTGYKDVSEIVVGDMVLTHTGEYHKVIRTNVRTAPTVKVSIVGYPEFTTTAEHPFYTLKKRKATYNEYKASSSQRVFADNPEWTAAKDLDRTYFCGQHILEETIEDSDLSLEECWLFGRYIADGHVNKCKRKGRKNSYQYGLIISVGKDKVESFKSKITNIYFGLHPHTQSTYRATFSSMKYVNFILDNNFGRNAATKRVPELIFHLPIEKRKAFLQGYLSGDGCFSQGKWIASTISKELAFDIQRLATSIFKTNVSVAINKPCKEHYIGNRIIKSNYPIYTVLIPVEIKKQSVCHVQNNIMWTQVKGVAESGIMETVYNIEVETDNSYTVNNCIVHNCTYWSIAKNKDRETVASGMGWDLFSQYVRALKEAQPKYFIYENNKGMSDEIRASITETFGFDPICINSALVSAQARHRLYWVGRRNENGTYDKVDVKQPEDKGIIMQSIVDDAIALRKKARTVISSCGRTTDRECFKKQQSNMVAIPVANLNSNNKYKLYDIKDGKITVKDKQYPIELSDGVYAIRKLTVKECQRLQTIPEWYEFPISDSQAYKCIGNGWTCDVITHLIQSALSDCVEKSIWD